MKKKCLIVSPKNKTIINFRKDLILSLIEKGYEVQVIGPNKDYLDDIEKLGAKFCEISLKKDKISPVNDLKYILKIRKIIKKENPSIVFAYTIKPIVYTGLSCSFRKVKFFPLLTGLGRSFGEGANPLVLKMVKFLYKASLSRASQVIFQNNDDKTLFINEKIVDEKKAHVVLGSGVNMERFKPLSFPSNIEFIMISRLLHEKGFTFYLDAIHKLKQKYPEVVFTLVGAIDSSLSLSDKKKLDSAREKNEVNYLGEVADPSRVIGQSSIFVLPTFYREGLPRTILEAMACGKPVITTNWVGSKETVNDGENGFLIPIKNSDVLLEKMEFFIKNPEKIQIMGSKSYEMCRERFEVNKVNRRIFKIWGI